MGTVSAKMKRELTAAARVLAAGGVIVYPTDTVWGIGACATDARAVQKVFALKRRTESKSLIILVDSMAMLEKYVDQIPKAGRQAIAKSRRPLTIVYPNARNLPKNSMHADGSVAIRLTKDTFCRELLRYLGKPIISTSANISGAPTPGNFSEIDDSILLGAGYVVGLRQRERRKGKPSRILKVEDDGRMSVIRK